MVKKNDTVKDKEKVDFWLKFSMQPQKEEDIRNMILNFDSKYICYSYICRFSRLSESFIEELVILSSGLLKNDCFYKENYEKLSNALEVKRRYERNRNNKELRMEYEKTKNIELKYGYSSSNFEYHKTTVNKIKDRLDWVYISQFQKLSKEFIIRHRKDVHWDSIAKSQDVDQAFCDKYRPTLSAPIR